MSEHEEAIKRIDAITARIIEHGEKALARAEAAQRLRTLAANLGIAGVLCRAHCNGYYHGINDGCFHEWQPGCQREAP